MLHSLPAGKRFQSSKQSVIITKQHSLSACGIAAYWKFSSLLKGKATAKLKNLSRSTSQGPHNALALALNETQEDTNAFAVGLPTGVTLTGLRASVYFIRGEKKLAAQFGVRTLL